MALTDRDLGDLYDRFAPYVYALAKKVSRDRDGAEDITQEVFILLWQRIERFDPERGSMRAWIGTLTHHTAVAWVRKQVAARRRENAQEAPGAVDDVETTVLSRLAAARTRAAMALLPSSQRQAVELAYVDGLTYREVAKHAGVPEGTAKTRLRRALANMAVALA